MPVTEYTWNPLTDSVIEETDGAGNVLVEYVNEPSAYGPLLSQHKPGEDRYFHFDALGSTRSLTDESGNVTDTFTYDAWGNQVEHTGVSEAGYKWLALLSSRTSFPGLYTTGTRLYEPDSGRLNSMPSPIDSYYILENSPIRVSFNSGTIPILFGGDFFSGKEVNDDNSGGIIRIPNSPAPTNSSGTYFQSSSSCQCSGGCWVSCPIAPKYCTWLTFAGNGCCSPTQVKKAQQSCQSRSICSSLCQCASKNKGGVGGYFYNCADRDPCEEKFGSAFPKCASPFDYTSKQQACRVCNFSDKCGVGGCKPSWSVTDNIDDPEHCTCKCGRVACNVSIFCGNCCISPNNQAQKVTRCRCSGDRG